MNGQERGKSELDLYLLCGMTLAIAVVFPILSVNLPTWDMGPVLVVYVGITAFLSVYDWQLRRHRRSIFIRNHIKKTSSWRGILKGGYLMFLVSAFKSMVLALALFTGLLTGPWLILLMISIPLVVYTVHHLLWQRLETDIEEHYLALFTERLATRVSLAILVLLYVFVSFFLPQPDYTGVKVIEAATQVLFESIAHTEFISVIRAATEIQQFVFAWAVQNLMQDVEQRWLIIIGWSSIFLKGSLSLLPVINLCLFMQRNYKHSCKVRLS